MSRNEQFATPLSATLRAFTNLRERFGVRGQNKEQEIIAGLPPVYLRLFGNIDYVQQLKDIPDKFKSRVVILTTSDTPDDIVNSLHEDNWSIVRAKEVTAEQARTNSSLLLNEAVQNAIVQHEPYVFFLSSGFQRHLGMFYSMYESMRQKYPRQDVYYFVLPETHEGISLQSHTQMSTDNIEEYLLRGFPYETALFMNTSMPLFETDLSQKGRLGTTQKGIPLGGMEFFITLLDLYKRHTIQGKVFSPRMLGITLPMLTRSNKALIEFYRSTHELPSDELDRIHFAPSEEVTSTGDKRARRVATFRAAFKHLGLTAGDIRNLFSQTQFECGITEAFKFEDNNTAII